MITEFQVTNYGCVKDVKAKLTPVHAFIGPNDSGKSTLLHAVREAVEYAGGQFAQSPWRPFKPRLVDATSLKAISLNGWYEIKQTGKNAFESWCAYPDAQVQGPTPRESHKRSALALPERPSPHQANLLRSLRGARLLRLDPDALRQPSGLIPGDVDFANERGAGLPGVLQAIQGRGDGAFESVRKSVSALFPVVKRVGVRAASTETLALEVELVDGTIVGSTELSEGLLYYLAFAALQYLKPTSMLLLEEPENGLHPSRIAEVMRVLREFSKSTETQVLMATHSPLVVNCLVPDEVSVVTRADIVQGTRVTPIRETPNFEKRASVYALGELWLSYADGNVEAPLLESAE